MDIQELNQYILDPSKSISFVLDRMSEDSNNKLSFQDPTHPAINILEASAFMASACLNKINTTPNLKTNPLKVRNGRNFTRNKRNERDIGKRVRRIDKTGWMSVRSVG